MFALAEHVKRRNLLLEYILVTLLHNEARTRNKINLVANVIYNIYFSLEILHGNLHGLLGAHLGDRAGRCAAAKGWKWWDLGERFLFAEALL